MITTLCVCDVFEIYYYPIFQIHHTHTDDFSRNGYPASPSNEL